MRIAMRRRRFTEIAGYALPRAAACVMLGLLGAVGVAHAAGKLPETTPEGLVLQKKTKLEVVYLRPGVKFGGYDKVALLKCAVAFRKNWQNEQSGAFLISKKDMDNIRAKLAEEFRKIFVDELTSGGYKVVDYGAPDVLVLRPAIINLDIASPAAAQPAGIGGTFSASAGQMTLYLEAYDSVTNELLARVVDPEAGRDSGMIQFQGAVTNKVEADRILKKWARILRGALDAAHGKPPKK